MNNQGEGQKEKIFQNFGKKVDQFLVELNEAGEKLQKEFEEEFEELKETAEKVKREVEDKERWKEVEANLKKAADEFNEAFRAAFRKRTPRRLRISTALFSEMQMKAQLRQAA